MSMPRTPTLVAALTLCAFAGATLPMMAQVRSVALMGLTPSCFLRF